ncbi:MAG: transposase [Gammaproteobacteria bacterium]
MPPNIVGESFGSVPTIFVPNNFQSAVTTACRHEPELNRKLEGFAAHYGAVVIPARAAKPKDKAKVEPAVLVVRGWIVARLRHQRCFSRGALNSAIAALLRELNHRSMPRLGRSRREGFVLVRCQNSAHTIRRLTKRA